MALRRLLHPPVVICVIVGADTLEQLAQNLAAPEIGLTGDEWAHRKAAGQRPAEYRG